MKPTPYNLLKGIRYFKNYGLKEFIIRLKEKSEPEHISYQEWYPAHCVKEEVLLRQRKESGRWKNAPQISILADVSEISQLRLQQMIDALKKQSYTNWELCIAENGLQESLEAQIYACAKEDKRIRYRKLDRNMGNAAKKNAALEMEKGDYIGLLGNGDLLSPDCLYEMAKAVLFPKEIRQSGVHWDTYYEKMRECGILQAKEGSSIDIIYTDSDMETEDGARHYAPQLKPDFSLDLLRSNNYIQNFFFVRRELAEKLGGFSTTFEKAWEYDFIFRCIEQAEGIVHIPKILYHKRENEAEHSTAEWEKRAVEAHLARTGVKAQVELTENAGFYKVIYPVQKPELISIIIPNKDEIETLHKCLQSVAASAYTNYEVIIVENNSEKAETFSYYKKLQQENPFVKTDGTSMPIRVVTWESHGVFNYSAINNYGIRFANGAYVVLLNNDIQMLAKDWLEQLLGNCQRPEVGITGVRLYYPDDTIQHAGIVVGIGGHARGAASNMLTGTARESGGYLQKAATQLNYSAVTAACLMIRKSVFEEIGGFTERLTIAFNDVDLCLKVRKAGYQIVYNPYVEAYHYESKSRGQEDSEEKVRRFQTEIEYMRTQWNDILRYGDPFYNPNFSRVKCNYSLNGMDA